MADELVFEAYFEGEVKKVKISTPMGVGGIVYFINIGGYHHGRIWKVDNQGWKWGLADWHTGDDIFVLIDIIERNFDERGRLK